MSETALKTNGGQGSDQDLNDVERVLAGDVEGFEGPVVRGALALIKRMRPVVLMDTHPQMGAELGTIEQSFQSLGYRLSRIDDPMTLLDHLPRREMDVLCSP